VATLNRSILFSVLLSFPLQLPPLEARVDGLVPASCGAILRLQGVLGLEDLSAILAGQPAGRPDGLLRDVDPQLARLGVLLGDDDEPFPYHPLAEGLMGDLEGLDRLGDGIEPADVHDVSPPNGIQG